MMHIMIVAEVEAKGIEDTYLFMVFVVNIYV